MTEADKAIIDDPFDYPIGITDADHVPPLEFNAHKPIDYLISTGKTFSELTQEELENLK